MPRIPESAVTVGLPSVSSQPIREVLEIGDAVMGLTEASVQLASRLAQAQRADELTQKSSALEGGLADLQLAIAQDPNLRTVESAGQAYKDGATEIFAEHGQSDSQVVSRALEKQFLQSSLQGSVSVRKSAFGRQADTSIAGLDAATDGFKRAYVSAADDEKREEVRELYVRSVGLNAYLSDQDKVNQVQSFDTFTDTSRVRGMIDAGFLDEAEDLLLDPAELIGMDELKRQGMMRTLNRARDRADKDIIAVRKQIEDATAKDAYEAIAAFDEGQGPEFTFADWQRALPNLSFTDARTLRTAMEKQGVTVIDNRPIASDLNREVEAGNSDVVDHIHSAYRANDITEGTFNRLLGKNHQYNNDPIRANPYKQTAKDIRVALGPLPFETEVGAEGVAVQRVSDAIDELDHFRETHAKATPTQIREEGARIRKAYQIVDIGSVFSRPAPYSLDTRKPTLVELDAALLRLGQDFKSGVVDDWQFTRAERNIQVFRADVQRREVDSGANQ